MHQQPRPPQLCMPMCPAAVPSPPHILQHRVQPPHARLIKHKGVAGGWGRCCACCCRCCRRVCHRVCCCCCCCAILSGCCCWLRLTRRRLLLSRCSLCGRLPCSWGSVHSLGSSPAVCSRCLCFSACVCAAVPCCLLLLLLLCCVGCCGCRLGHECAAAQAHPWVERPLGQNILIPAGMAKVSAERSQFGPVQSHAQPKTRPGRSFCQGCSAKAIWRRVPAANMSDRMPLKQQPRPLTAACRSACASQSRWWRVQSQTPGSGGQETEEDESGVPAIGLNASKASPLVHGHMLKVAAGAACRASAHAQTTAGTAHLVGQRLVDPLYHPGRLQHHLQADHLRQAREVPARHAGDAAC